MPSEQRGKTAILQALRPAFEQALHLTVSEEIFPTTDPALVIAHASTSGMMRNGIAYQNEVVAFFRFGEDGRIVEWTGYINPLPIIELMNARAALSDANHGRQS